MGSYEWRSLVHHLRKCLTHLFFLIVIQKSLAVDVKLQLPIELIGLHGELRLDYHPSLGFPPPNSTFYPRNHPHDFIVISDVLPGTEYAFQLYYTNVTVKNLLIWTNIIETEPEPPLNLIVDDEVPEVVKLIWDPPSSGGYTGFKLSVLSLEKNAEPRTFYLAEESSSFVLQDLSPGSLFEFQLSSIFHHKESAAFLSYNFTTRPNPPTNLLIDIQSGKLVELFWDLPSSGGYTAFKLKVISLPSNEARIYDVREESIPFALQDLIPGGTYKIHLTSTFHNKESIPLSHKFTTKPNPPGRFIVWFRNETTLVVLWQPPYPTGIFDEYLISIFPKDSYELPLRVEKGGDPPGPVQTPINGLVPGRLYKISVQTVSQNQSSDSTEANYYTVPLSPTDINFSKQTTNSFEVRWSPPSSFSEFDRYQVTLGTKNSKTVNYDEERFATFDSGLEPGQTYEITVKTLSDNVASWPLVGNVTTRPLPVITINASSVEAGEIWIEWTPSNKSIQDSYLVSYYGLEAFNSDSRTHTVNDTSYHAVSLLPGRNYSVSVMAVSNGIQSQPTVFYQATKPAPPVIEILEPVSHGWNISWKSDVTSYQDSYSVVFIRNDTGEKFEMTTQNNWAVVKNLYAGASYEIRVYAISYGLWSDPHSYFHVIHPNPPTNVQITKARNSTMVLTWSAPQNSLVDQYVIRYRAVVTPLWRETAVISGTSCEIKNLLAGEKYFVEIASVTNKVESTYIHLEQAIAPNAVKHVLHILHSHNIIFKWLTPQDRKDYYIIDYYPVKAPSHQKTQQIPANGTQPGETMSVTVDNLMPGDLYAFLFYVASYNLRSEVVHLQTRTLPVIDSVIYIVINEKETRTLRIKYTPTPSHRVIFDRYRFQITGTKIPVQDKLSNDTNRLVVFDNLIPGKLYNISIWTISGGVYSIPIYRQARLYPEPVEEITGTIITDVEITLTWKAPSGKKDGYEVQYQDHKGNLIKNITFTERSSYKELVPHHNYTFVVVVVSGYDTSTVLRSRPVSKTLHTLESVPGKVHNFTMLEISPNEIRLQWSLPLNDWNGILTGFKISYYVKQRNPLYQYKMFGPTVSKGTISNLTPGKPYIFEIQAHTKVGPGSKVILEQDLPVWSPPSPEPHVFPIDRGHSTTTINIRFKKNFFSTINGLISAYTLIVAEDDSKESNLLKLPSWGDVQKYTLWPPYQVTKPYYPFNDTTVEDYTIGNEFCQGIKGYCNGPLKPGTSYRIKVRAFTTPDQFTDTIYSYQMQTDSDNTALIVGVVVVLLLLIVVIIITIVMTVCRNRMRCKNKDKLNAQPEIMNIPENEVVTNRPVKLKDFAQHYNLMSADSDFRFSEEFDQLKHVGRDRLSTASDLPMNRPKNRFTNILPYDHSRVKLMPADDEEGSDYINANYVSGYNSPREFIVTQGPLHSTTDDFWRMIWEQNCRAIVMLTRCVEKGREKCHHYWPYDTQPTYYGDIQVTVFNESQYSEWTTSEFKVCKGDQFRILHHFHFTLWPDFGVPDPPQTLVKFVRAFREKVKPDGKPIVVHCSAGVGRSGTFIALDNILQHIEKYDYVDIFGIVFEMRKDRMWMVQNEQQYICIYQCLLCVLEGNEDIRDPYRVDHLDNRAFEDDEGIAESGI